MSSRARHGAGGHPEHRPSHRASSSLPIPRSSSRQIRLSLATLGSGPGCPAESGGERPGPRVPWTSTQHPRGHLGQPRPGDSDGAAGPPQPSHPPTWHRDVKEAPAAAPSAPPDRGSRPRVPGLVPARGDPRASAGRGWAAGPAPSEESESSWVEEPEMIPGTPESSSALAGSRETAPPGPVNAARPQPGAPGIGAAARTGRAGAAGPCPFPESPAGHRHTDGGIPSGPAAVPLHAPIPAPLTPSTQSSPKSPSRFMALSPGRRRPPKNASVRSRPGRGVGPPVPGLPRRPRLRTAPRSLPPSPALPARPAGTAGTPGPENRARPRAGAGVGRSPEGEGMGAPMQPPGGSSGFHFFFPKAAQRGLGFFGFFFYLAFKSP